MMNMTYGNLALKEETYYQDNLFSFEVIEPDHSWQLTTTNFYDAPHKTR